MADDDAATMLEDCEARESKLSEWEQNFIDSIAAWVKHGNSLSQRQYERLTMIWERVT